MFCASVGLKQVSDHWFLSRDGEPLARELFDRHYSRRHYTDGREPKLFVGPGEKMVLIDENCTAVFIWRKFICDIQPPQTGINCAAFRNESKVLSSSLILEAEQVAHTRWPSEPFWTLINSKKITSTNPGYCFLKAGWIHSGTSKVGLVILRKDAHSVLQTPYSTTNTLPS